MQPAGDTGIVESIATPLQDVNLVELQPAKNEQVFCAQEFAGMRINFQPVQSNLSRNLVKGTLCGMHYQTEPHSESKSVRVVQGGIYDVDLDLQPEPPSFGRWYAAELTKKMVRPFLFLKAAPMDAKPYVQIVTLITW